MKLTKLEIKNLSLGIKKQEDIYLVKNVSFSVKRGETLGIVGESGSGKTLSTMAIIDLLPDSISVKSGEILAYTDDQSIKDLLKIGEREKEKLRGKNITVIFQEAQSSLNPTTKCGKQVEEAIRSHHKFNNKEYKNQVLELFHETGLPDPMKIYNSYPFQISGGQQQRVMIAMAIANKPDFIIADEPTTALDVLVQKKVIQLLGEIQQKYGMGIIFISHDIDLVAKISNQIVVMKDGEIVESGKTGDTINAPKSLYTQGLLNCKPRPDTPKGKLTTINANPGDVTKNNTNPEYINANSSETILEFRNVDINYHIRHNLLGKASENFHAVKDISFKVFKHETFGIVGGSGSGKSTLGKSILGLIDKMNGNIFYHNLDIAKISGKEIQKIRKKIQLVFQDPYSSLNPKIRIGQCLIEVILFHGLCKNIKDATEKAKSVLKDVSLHEDYFNRYPHELSGGQRQRVVIARALAMEPELLICDESVSALDVSVQAEVLNLLNELKSTRSLTYLFISHDLSVVKYMSDRIMVLKEGEIQEISIPDELFESPRSVYGKELLDAMLLYQR